MPIIYVHGVAVRDELSFPGIKAFLRHYIAASIVIRDARLRSENIAPIAFAHASTQFSPPLSKLLESCDASTSTYSDGTTRNNNLFRASFDETRSILGVSLRLPSNSSKIGYQWIEWATPSGDLIGLAVPSDATRSTRPMRSKAVRSINIYARLDAELTIKGVDVFPYRRKHIDYLYSAYRTEDPIAAGNRALIDFGSTDESYAVNEVPKGGYAELRATLRDKVDDDLGALEASLILLRSRAFDVLYGHTKGPNEPINYADDWLCNLAQWFQGWRADASVIVLQRFVSDPNGARADFIRVSQIFDQLLQQPLPSSDEAVRYLVELTRLASNPNAQAVDHVAAIYGGLTRCAK